MDITSELSKTIKQHLGWNKARIDCFAKMIVAVLTVRTVNLMAWAQVFVTTATPDAAYMRIKRFMRYFEWDAATLARFIFKLFHFAEGRWYLTLDRTTWRFGKQSINFLMLAVVYKGIAVPLLWTLVTTAGNSTSQERIALLQRFEACFGTEVIAGVLADREFVGKEWFAYLVQRNIPFFIRIKWNFLISNARGQPVPAWQLFTGLKAGEKRVLEGKRRLFGLLFHVAGLRTAQGDFLIVATTEAAETAIETYAYRWEIETLFAALKTRGFHLEATHLTRLDRLAKLMAVLAIAFCWAHKTGEWQQTIKPIKIKKHGRKAISLFHYGLNHLQHFLCGLKRTRKEALRFVQLLVGPPPLTTTAQAGLIL